MEFSIWRLSIAEEYANVIYANKKFMHNACEYGMFLTAPVFPYNNFVLLILNDVNRIWK